MKRGRNKREEVTENKHEIGVKMLKVEDEQKTKMSGEDAQMKIVGDQMLKIQNHEK